MIPGANQERASQNSALDVELEQSTNQPFQQSTGHCMRCRRASAIRPNPLAGWAGCPSRLPRRGRATLIFAARNEYRACRRPYMRACGSMSIPGIRSDQCNPSPLCAATGE